MVASWRAGGGERRRGRAGTRRGAGEGGGGGQRGPVGHAARCGRAVRGRGGRQGRQAALHRRQRSTWRRSTRTSRRAVTRSSYRQPLPVATRAPACGQGKGQHEGMSEPDLQVLDEIQRRVLWL